MLVNLLRKTASAEKENKGAKMSNEFDKANELINGENKFLCEKKPIKLAFEVAMFDTVVQTKEGEQEAKKGSAIITGTKGERWPIPWEMFKATYKYQFDPIGEAKMANVGKCFKKPLPVFAVKLDEPFAVRPSWSDKPLNGKTGDYLVRYGEDDFGIVDAEIFAETYVKLIPKEKDE